MNLISYNDFLNEVHIIDTKEFDNKLKMCIDEFFMNNTHELGTKKADDLFIKITKKYFCKPINGCNIIFKYYKDNDTKNNQRELYKFIDAKGSNSGNIYNSFLGYENNGQTLTPTIKIIFDDGYTEKIKNEDKFINVLSSIYNHENIHYKQTLPIQNSIMKLNYTLDDKYQLITNIAYKMNASNAYKKKNLTELSNMLSNIISNLPQINYEDMYNNIDNIENFNELNIKRLNTELSAVSFVSDYLNNGKTVHDILKLMDKKEITGNKIWDDNKNDRYFIENISLLLVSAIKHPSKKIELDADASTILKELDRNLNKDKEQVRKFIEKPTLNSPSHTLNYYTKLFGTNTNNTVIKDLKKRLGKYYVAFYSGVDKLTKKLK